MIRKVQPNEAPDDAHPERALNQRRGLSLRKPRRGGAITAKGVAEFAGAGGAAGISNFTPLFLAARGLDVALAGVVLAVAQVCRFLGGLASCVADKTGRFWRPAGTNL